MRTFLVDLSYSRKRTSARGYLIEIIEFSPFGHGFGSYSAKEKTLNEVTARGKDIQAALTSKIQEILPRHGIKAGEQARLIFDRNTLYQLARNGETWDNQAA